MAKKVWYVFTTSGVKKIIAPSRRDAMYKYLGSKSHMKTEAGIIKIRGGGQHRPKKRKSSIWGGLF